MVLCACCSGQHQPGNRLGSSFQCLCSIRGHLDLSSALCSAISSCPLLGDPSPSSVRPLLQGPGFWSPQLLPVAPSAQSGSCFLKLHVCMTSEFLFCLFSPLVAIQPISYIKSSHWLLIGMSFPFQVRKHFWN